MRRIHKFPHLPNRPLGCTGHVGREAMGHDTRGQHQCAQCRQRGPPVRLGQCLQNGLSLLHDKAKGGSPLGFRVVEKNDLVV